MNKLEILGKREVEKESYKKDWGGLLTWETLKVNQKTRRW